MFFFVLVEFVFLFPYLLIFFLCLIPYLLTCYRELTVDLYGPPFLDGQPYATTFDDDGRFGVHFKTKRTDKIRENNNKLAGSGDQTTSIYLQCIPSRLHLFISPMLPSNESSDRIRLRTLNFHPL